VSEDQPTGRPAQPGRPGRFDTPGAGQPAAGPARGQDPGWFRRRRARKKRRLAAMSRRGRIGRRVAVVFTWLLSLLVVVMVVASAAFYQLTRVPNPTDLPAKQVATILYSDGSVMARIGPTNRTDVTISQVPEAVRFDVLAAEDRGFYSESGISFRGTARAALNDLKGGNTQGGSGITQQYVKNVYLNDSRTLSRKLKELAIAVKIDRQYSKNQILEWYLNTIYFGRGAYGIQAAAQAYFGVNVEKLTLNQGAMLAGLIQAPSDYDPAVAPTLARQRWNYVLDGMVSTGHLGAGTRAGLTFPKTVRPSTTQLGSTGPVGLIVNRVKAELSADGVDEAELNTGGLRILTTIDKSAQQKAQDAIAKAYAHPTAKQKNLKKALVAITPATGAVVAYYGGANGKSSYVDYAQAWRQPGSSFKPYTLATALQQNVDGKKPAYNLSSRFDAKSPVRIEGTLLHNDPSDPTSGHFTLKQSMTQSLNTVYATLAHDVGDANVAATAHAMGIPAVRPGTKTKTLQLNGSTGFRIGIGGYEVRPIDQATGYATIANGGTTHPSYFVQKVTTSTGRTIFTRKTKGTRALDPKVANDTAFGMEGVAAFAKQTLADGRTVACKTGTAGIEATSKNSDAWMVGFTTQISVASWVGSNSLSPIYNNSGSSMYGRNNAGTAWKLFMNSYLDGKSKSGMPSKQEIGSSSSPDSSSTGSSSAPATTQTTTSAPSTPTSSAPTTTSAPPTTTSAPSTTTSAPPTTTSAPSTTTSAPPTSTSAPPTTTAPATTTKSKPKPAVTTSR
jgi:membrane peptidoglycan carboxypeptidase